MNVLSCAVCHTPGYNLLLGPQQQAEFWARKGVNGRPPKGLEVRGVVECLQRLELPNRDVCGCLTAWVRDAPDEAWRPIVMIPAGFVASIAAARS